MTDVVWITPKLAVSGRQRLQDSHRLAQGITSILNLTMKPDPKWTFQTHNDGTPDDGQPKSKHWFSDGINFALAAMHGDGKVLVHCEAGVNRGPSMVYAILRAQGRSVKESSELVLKKTGLQRIKYADDAEKAIGN